MLSRGRMFMEHQRFIVDVAHELDPATGLLWYDTVVIVIMRQNGKTTIVESVLVFHAQRAPFRQMIYAAQNADKAREKLVDEFFDQRLRTCPFFTPNVRARRSNGSAHIRFTDTGSKIFVVPSNDSAADGKTLAAGVLDEAFVYGDTSIISSVQPTMATLPDPQLTICSTRGTGDDGLLLHYEDVGVAAVNDPDSRLAYFEYSAGPDDDCADPATWARIMPALGQTITVDRLKSYRRSMGTAEFDRSFCNRRPTVALTSALDLEDWSTAARDPDTPLPILPPYSAGVHIHPDRHHATIGVVGRLDDDDRGAELGMVIDRRPGTGWIVDALEQLVARGCELIAADRVAGAGGIIDRAAGRDLAIDELAGTDVASMCGTLVDELAAGTVAHQDQPDLSAAAHASRKRPLGAAFAFDQRKTSTDLSPLNAITWALGNYRRVYPAGARLDRIH